MKSMMVVLILWGSTIAGRAQDSAGLQVVFGTGNPPPWASSITVSSMSIVSTRVILSATPDQTCPSETACTVADLDPFATVTLAPPPFEGVGLTYVGSTGSPSRPAVAARAFDNTGRSVDLPVFRLDNLRAQPPSLGVLAFAGAIGGSNGRSNLLLANIGPADQQAGLVFLDIAVVNESGQGPGGIIQTVLAFGETLFIQDIASEVGSPSLDDGQVRVTMRGGGGPIWGVMPVVRADGSLSVVSAALP